MMAQFLFVWNPSNNGMLFCFQVRKLESSLARLVDKQMAVLVEKKRIREEEERRNICGKLF